MAAPYNSSQYHTEAEQLKLPLSIFRHRQCSDHTANPVNTISCSARSTTRTTRQGRRGEMAPWPESAVGQPQPSQRRCYRRRPRRRCVAQTGQTMCRSLSSASPLHASAAVPQLLDARSHHRPAVPQERQSGAGARRRRSDPAAAVAVAAAH